MFFAASMVVFHASYAFQVFRHLLPVVALGCVATGVGGGWLGERLRRPRLVAALAVGLLVALFARGDVEYVVARARLRDSRTQAIEWLLRHRHPSQPVMVLRESPLHGEELRRLGGRILVRSWDEARPAVWRAEPRFLLVADLVRRDGSHVVPVEQRPPLFAAYQVRAAFGDQTGPAYGALFLDNRLRVFVLERRPGARRPRDAERRAVSPSTRAAPG
jgi:hypothetical protein